MNRYQLNKEGIDDFLDDVLGDVLDRGEYNPIEITIGNRTVCAALFPETFEALEELLKLSFNILEEE